MIIIVINILLESVLVGILPPVSLRKDRDWLAVRAPSIVTCGSTKIIADLFINGVVVGSIERIDTDIRKLVHDFIPVFLSAEVFRTDCTWS